MRVRNFLFVPALAIAMAAACTAEQTQEGELPDVDVSGGQMPKVDVDAADVTVSQDTQTIVTPDVDVTPPGQNP